MRKPTQTAASIHTHSKMIMIDRNLLDNLRLKRRSWRSSWFHGPTRYRYAKYTSPKKKGRWRQPTEPKNRGRPPKWGRSPLVIRILSALAHKIRITRLAMSTHFGYVMPGAARYLSIYLLLEWRKIYARVSHGVKRQPINAPCTRSEEYIRQIFRHKNRLKKKTIKCECIILNFIQHASEIRQTFAL